MKQKYYKLSDSDMVYGTFVVNTEGEVVATQQKWVWKKVDGVNNGLETFNVKKPREMESFFTVNTEITEKEFNHLWGLNLERL